MTRRRLSPQQRRDELLDAGATLFAEGPYEDVLMDDVAVHAGVTRALVYHYFATKRDLYVAVFQRASDRLLLAANIRDPHRSSAERLRAGLDAHIQYFVDHPLEAVTVNRGALAGDPAVQAIIAEELGAVGSAIVDSLDVAAEDREVITLAVHGWLAFVRSLCVEWIGTQTISREQLVELCLRTFAAAVGGPAGDR